MSRKSLKTITLLALLGVVAYNSVYFKKLDEVKAESGLKAGSTFDATGYASTFWSSKLMPKITNDTASIADLTTLIPLLKTDPAKAFDTYSHALGIGNIRYFLVKGEGKISGIKDDAVTVSTTNGDVNLATDYIFGNAARDASGLIKITDFGNAMDLNNVSAEINAIIRAKVIPGLKANAKKGAQVNFVGAIELNKAHLHLDHLDVTPISITVIP